MNRFLISACLIALTPLAAQAQTAAPAKPSAKKPAATPVEPSKPKVRLMTLEQLRKCFKLKDDNAAEGAALEAEKIAVEQARAKLQEDRAAILKQSETLQAESLAIVNEQTTLREAAKEFEKPVERADKDEAEAKRVKFNALLEANSKRTEAFNTARIAFNSAKVQLDERIAESNKSMKAFQTRVDEHNYGLEDWKAECANRPYAEADEALIMKERGK